MEPAFSVMAMDILGNVLSRADNPAELGTYLTEEIRDLTGAHCVLLVQCLCTGAVAEHRVVSVEPVQRREWAESPAVERLYDIIHRMPEAQPWRGAEPAEAAGLLRGEGFELSMVFPLNAGEFRVGAMLVLGLPDEAHITSVLRLLGDLSTVVALVLRNAILYEQIQRRTEELRDNNERLALELTERMRAEKEIQTLNEELEQRVRERTRELERRNFELEQMNKAFVGRELRMVELKERISILEKTGGTKS
jgi:ABC-type multidrug transport system fused ATPase/permease subunit